MHREEIYLRIQEENRAAAKSTTEQMRMAVETMLNRTNQREQK